LRANNVFIGKFEFTSNARAFIENERRGFVKCALDKNNLSPLAFWIVGENADKLINTASQILKCRDKKIIKRKFFHPSLSEALYDAYADALGKRVDKVKK
jgi:dihydrolipoamide dehydrogenase